MGGYWGGFPIVGIAVVVFIILILFVLFFWWGGGGCGFWGY